MDNVIEKAAAEYYGTKTDKKCEVSIHTISPKHTCQSIQDSIDTEPILAPSSSNSVPEMLGDDNAELNALRGACNIAREQYNEAVEYASAFRSTHTAMLCTGENLSKDVAGFIQELESRASSALSRLTILESEFQKRGGHMFEEPNNLGIPAPTPPSSINTSQVLYVFPSLVAQTGNNVPPRCVLLFLLSAGAHCDNLQ